MRISDWSSDVCSSDLLYGPNFEEHPAGTATSSLGAEIAYTPISISGVTGDGSAGDPYQVTVVDDVAGTGLRSTPQTRYVNGDGHGTESCTVQNNSKTGRERCKERVCEYG